MTDHDYSKKHHDQHSRRIRRRDGSPYRTRKPLVILIACTLLLCFLVAPVLSISGVNPNTIITLKPACTKPSAAITSMSVFDSSHCRELHLQSNHLFAGQSLTFAADSNNATSWKMDFGDGTTEPGFARFGGNFHVFSQPGTYTVIYTATNACGSTSDTRTVKIEPMSKGDIYIVSNPPDAWNNAVWVDGSASPPTGIRSMYNVPDGKVYKIKISQYGYEPYEQTVVGKGGDFVCVEANLVLAGSQQAATTTPTTAVTTVPYGLPVTNPTMNPTQAVVQSANFGSLSITSTPVGAAVFIDSDAKGVTPVTLTGIAPGAHTVLLKKSGFPDYTTTTAVVAGQVTIINADLSKGPQSAATTAPASTATTAPVPGEGSLSVSTTPQGAEVFVDGIVRGMTPATIPGLSPGQHAVLLKLDGYQEFNTTVSVTDGKTAEFNTALAKTQKSPGFAGILAVLAIAGIFQFRKRIV